MSEVATQTLHIVARELNVELNDARAALENFGEQQDDVHFLENCRERLHLVHGALRVAEVYGAALLAEEMEQVSRYLIGNFAEKRHLAEGLDALMRAMVQLPTYLERVLGGGRDMALILLPLLNDLRAVRGNALLSEGTLLLLNLTSEKQANPQPPAPGENALPVANWARKLRPRFQLGLLGWIKGERPEQNLDVLERSAEKLEQVATTQSVFQLWWVIGAVIEALRDGGLEGSASIKRLLGQADREMRRLYEQGEAQYAQRPPVELLNNLLYYLARATTSGPRVAAVRASFRLTELLPVDAHVEQARESLAAPSIKLMKTVASAIKEDLARVKDAFDLFVRKSGTQASELAPQMELLRKIGDTLGVLGLGALRDKVQTEIADLNGLVERKSPLTEAVLMRMASTLINIEDGLDEQLVGLILPTATPEDGAATGRDDIEFRQVTEAVLRECIVNMARIKEAIALSVERPKEAQILEQVPPLVRGITAGMLMLGKTRAVELTEAIGKALFKYVRADGVPVSQAAMDRLADAIVAVEYYMETLHAGRNDPWYMLDNAEVCLQALSELSSDGATGIHSLRDLSDHAATMTAEPLAGAATVVIDRADRTAIMSNAQQATQIIPQHQAAKQAAQQAMQPRDAGIPRTPVLAPSADKADPEFVELFIEEAREEITKLQQAFPMWDDNPQDVEALTSLRRSFHTLKGSGRMVGAQLIGEFAFSIETMLNRVINKTLERTPDMLVLMRRAVAAVPELVEQLESGRAPDADVYGMIAEANAIATVRDTMARKQSSSDADELAVSATPEPPRATRPAPPPPPQVAPPPRPTVSPVVAPRAAAPEESMDAVLQDIFSKETAGHLAAIREYVASCALLSAPYPVTDALHRACHTLSGTAKTAGARQGTKIAEPLNHYIRKLYDNGVGLPAAGMQVLRDSVRAIENVVEHINESTGYFLTHSSIIERIVKLETALDSELTMMVQAVEATAISPVPELRTPQAPPQQLSSSDEDVIELSFDANAEDHELGLDSPTRFSRALGHSGETIEVSIDQALMQEALRLGEKDRAASTPAAVQPRPQPRPETVTRSAPPMRAPMQTPVHAPAPPLERTQRIDPPTFPPKSGPSASLASNLANNLASNEVTARNLALPKALAAATNKAAVRSVINAPLDEFEVSRFDLGGIEVVEATMDMHPPGARTPDMVVETAAWAATYEPPSLPVQTLHQDYLLAPVAQPTSQPHASSPSQPVARAVTSQPVVIVPVVSAVDPVSMQDDVADDADDFDADVAAIFTEEAAELLDVADASLAMWSRDRANHALAFELKRAVHTLKGGARMAGIRAMGDLSHELESLMESVESGRVVAEQPVLDLLQASLDELHRMRDTVSQGKRVPVARDLMARIRAAMGLAPVVAVVVSATPQQLESPPAPSLVSAPAVVMHDDDAASAELQADYHVDELIAPTATAEETINVELTPSFDEAVVETVPEFVATPILPLASESFLVVETESDEVEIDDVEAAHGVAAPIALPGRDNVQAERGEVARVDAELLDMLLNNAGEVSILRSRLEQQTNSIDFNLAELARTVTRLKEQLRKLELETEAQILHRHQDESDGRTDFDPLELDRYSALQQLSRALAESVSDVASIESLLGSQTREAQNLLLQQSRVVTEVQNGLMRTRMVPFQRHVQRLSRIVRQVATETHKRADLVVTGASGELDRQVLERMLPPLEHMLRNSVVHGIETPDARVAAGKSDTGTIRIELHREGSEMVIAVQDDGRGIDVKAVRERAKERGLLKDGRKLTDEEALQLVLEPGFSTAASVTQHAGRGVGMDVVVAEIKKLGGALFTKSTPGQGVRFTIHLPFTLAISQALIVRIGEEMFALPLPTVEGVARVPRAEVAALLANPDSTFTYGTQTYHFQHLGAFIDAPASMLPDADVPVPVILVNAGEHSTGLVVDELVGNREIVVKPVGPQVSGIRGVAGATILGDGRIVVILDMGALVRSGWRASTGVAAPVEDRRTFALVVDDSITVRRVTQRLLERNGMRVATAKDGVDALAVLQDQTPDIILLDIEMPRMDGYEFAAQVRNDPRVADIPIVMITSRVGEKHRARAIELGVNDYLGKPYQENQLLDAIEPLVEARRRRAAARARA
jgi:chemosensory pili system protein ChpA (sensor histidine kinase/response regulator)